MAKVLTVKKPQIKTEQYPLGLRKPMTIAENEAQKKIQSQLEVINKKIIEYVKFAVENGGASFNNFLTPNDFKLDIYDSKPSDVSNDYSLLGIMGLGITYEAKNLKDVFYKQAIKKGYKVYEETLKKAVKDNISSYFVPGSYTSGSPETAEAVGFISPKGGIFNINPTGAAVPIMNHEEMLKGTLQDFLDKTGSARFQIVGRSLFFNSSVNKITQDQFDAIRKIMSSKNIGSLITDIGLSMNEHEFTSFQKFAEYVGKNKLLQSFLDEKPKEKMLGGYVKFPDLTKLLGIGVGVPPSDQVLLGIIRDRENGIAKLLNRTTQEKLDKILNKGIANGDSFDKISEMVAKALGFDETRAEVIARTETNWALNEGQRQYSTTLGITQYEISIADDACDECIALAKAGPYDISQEGLLPEHPNCRCFMYSVIPDDWFGDMEKNIREDVIRLEKDHQRENKEEVIQKSIKQIQEELEATKQEISTLPKVVKGIDGKDGKSIKGEQGDPGKDGVSIKGESGKDGYTPIKGKDYFTPNEIEELKKSIKPVKGIDYPSKKELEKLEKAIREIRPQQSLSEDQIQQMINEAVSRIQVIAPKPRFADIFGQVEENQTLVDYIGTHDADAWGEITGTLSDQTDLQDALDAKEPTLSKGNLTETTSSVLTITNGTNAVIGTGTSVQVTKATGSTNGYLSAIDWTTIFNHIANVNNPHSTSDANLITTNITTNNASILKHGFLPILSGSASQYLNGQGNYTTISAILSAPPGYIEVTFSGETTKNIVHNFGLKPVVQVLDDSTPPKVITPVSIEHNSDNDFTVTFAGPTTGTIIASVGSPPVPNVTTTAIDYAVLENDNIIIVTAFNKTITLPTAVGQLGKTYSIDNNSQGNIFVTGTGGETIQDELTQIVPSQSSMVVYSNNSIWRIT